MPINYMTLLNKNLKIFLLGVVGLLDSAQAETIKTIDGKVFNEVMIIDDSSDYIKFKHADGIARLPKSRILGGKDAPVVAGFNSAERVAFIKANATSVTTRDGRTFLTKDLSEVGPNLLKFMSDSGINKIKFTDLPVEAAVKLGWDKARSDEQDAKDAIQDQKNEQKRSLYLQAESLIQSSSFEGKIQPFQKVNAGWLCHVSERRKQTVSVETRRDYNALSGQIQVTRQNVEIDVSGPAETAIVWGLPDSLVIQRPKQAWSSQLYLVGKYRYGALGGDKQEVPIFFLDRNAAVNHLVRHGLNVVDDSDVIKNEKGSVIVKGWGSGFFITKDGIIATNHHVIEGAKTITVSALGKTFSAKTLAFDADHDLALIKIDCSNSNPIRIKSDKNASIGDYVFTIGFPRPSSQGVNPKFTEGSISSLTGLQDSDSRFQISVPIQPGNSGGPLVDESGSLFGVIVATLNYKVTVNEDAGLPQNVNYAVKSSYLDVLCQKAGVAIDKADAPSESKINRKETIAKIEDSVVLIEIEVE